MIDKEDEKKKDSWKRIDWDQYFMNVVNDIALRSTCIRNGRQLGAVIVNPLHQIVSTGYNGNPRGMLHCDNPDMGCIRDILKIQSGERSEICTAVHAEQNAMLQAGPKSMGCTMYTTVCPCNTCAKLIINAGIVRVVYLDEYPETMGKELLVSCEVDLLRL
jgi:dCMP deaminase